MANIQQKEIKRARAVIINSNKILLINRIKKNDSYWVMPGGRVEQGENNEQAVKRECLEELGIKVKIKRLFLKRVSDKPEIKGQYEFFIYAILSAGKLVLEKDRNLNRERNTRENIRLVG